MERFFRGYSRVAVVLSVLLPPVLVAEVYTYNNGGQFFQGWEVWPDSAVLSLMVVLILWVPWLFRKVIYWVVSGFSAKESVAAGDNILEMRVRQELQLDVPGIVERCEHVVSLPNFLPATYFAPPISETRKMYRMGYFYGAIMTAQATAEALARFIARSKGMDESYWCERDERNGGVSQAKRIEDMKQQKLISPRAFGHFRSILEKKRNSFHHMNSDVPTDSQSLEKASLECVRSLYSIEGAFLEVGSRGAVRVVDHELWDVRPDGRVSAYIDCKLI